MSLNQALFGQTFIRKVPVILTFFVSICFITIIASKLTEDTTSTFNIAFGACAALSGLCFRMSSSIEAELEHKRRMAYSGERFLHAALTLAICSILKYAALELNSFEWMQGIEWVRLSVEITFHSLSLPLFIWAVLDAYGGINIANDILWERLYNEEDWDSII